MAKVKIENFVKELELEVLYDAELEEIEILTANLNRPGLQLAGFFDYFATDRIQVLGKVEMTYLTEFLNLEQRLLIIEKFLEYDIPCVLVSRGQEVPDEIMEIAKKYKRPFFRSNLITTKLFHSAISYLDMLLAPQVSRHGVLMDINGVGVYLIGESGIGKSETALEMVKRGHRLVADDVVDICKVGRNQLIGESPESIRHFMEIRGVGIIDVRQMYGVGSVINKKTIDLVIRMEVWETEKSYERLGLTDDFITILGVKLTEIVIPVRPGRNLAIIIEVAARNYRLKYMGYNSAAELSDRLHKGQNEF
ncbi:MAG: HPr kinase/phosphorylase [Clostridiales bacterium]|nr:HPr kinase/phosphorylase [Clostridiales bacterium]